MSTDLDLSTSEGIAEFQAAIARLTPGTPEHAADVAAHDAVMARLRALSDRLPTYIDLPPGFDADGMATDGSRRRLRAQRYDTASPSSRLPVFGAPVDPKADAVEMLAAGLWELAEFVLELGAADRDACDRDDRIAQLVRRLRPALAEDQPQEDAGAVFVNLDMVGEQLGRLQRQLMAVQDRSFAGALRSFVVTHDKSPLVAAEGI